MEQTSKILIIEDEDALRRGLEDNFRFEGFTVFTAADGEAGIEMALAQQPALIVLDIMLPHVDGYEVCETLRNAGCDTPILILTAKGQEKDIILGLNLGADDYVTKPFSIHEVLARARALLRRTGVGQSTQINFGACTLDTAAHTLTREGAEVTLTPKEYGVLALLVSRSGRVVTREQLLQSVWGYSVFVTERSVDRCVATLRKKIEADSRRPVYLRTVREAGYRFTLNGD